MPLPKRASQPTLDNLLLAYRQAKHAIASERGAVGLIDVARFESRLHANLVDLGAQLRKGEWFTGLEIGRLVVMPKAAIFAQERSDVIHVGHSSQAPVDLTVRLQLEPTLNFTITEVLYLWEFGPALEAVLSETSLGYRLNGIQQTNEMDRFARSVYEYWPRQFAHYRDDPITTAKAALRAGKRVVVTSTDVVSFFDRIRPEFLLSREFIDRITFAARAAGRRFNRREYKLATTTLLSRFADFRLLRRRVGGSIIDVNIGVPIGALTSRLFANVALAGLDAHVESLPRVKLYRRYVDDIVVVAISQIAEGRGSKAEVLAGLFPQFTKGTSPHNDSFVAPDTGEEFQLNETKTRVHDLYGEPGIHFLNAVRESFSAVTSERRALIGNAGKLATDIDTINLFADESNEGDRLPRLRDADKLTLRRYMATAFIRGLERSVLMLSTAEARRTLRTNSKRMLAILDGEQTFDDFEIVLSLYAVGLLSEARSVIAPLSRWLEQRLGEAATTRILSVKWAGFALDAKRALREMQRYLRRRVEETTARACSLSAKSNADKADLAARDGLLLRYADLRHLDREDELVRIGSAIELPAEILAEHRWLTSKFERGGELQQRLQTIREFIAGTVTAGECIWKGVTPLALLLSVHPPRYVDVARRFLTKVEGVEAGGLATVGRMVDKCVDALRGTLYSRRKRELFVVEVGPQVNTLRLDSGPRGTKARVILSNLPVSHAAFDAALAGAPKLTYARLSTLDRTLRNARRAARAARETPSILLLPELSIPRQWVRPLAEYAAKEQLAIVAGVEYARLEDGVVNQAVGIFPGGRDSAAFVTWTKQIPARVEDAALRKAGLAYPPAVRSLRRLVVESGHGRLGTLICSEILEAEAIAALRGRIELLLVPAWNTDTSSFDYVVHAASSMLLHAFIGVANNAESSDTRIVAPVREPRHERDWCRLLHRKETQIIWGDLPLAELRQAHGSEPVFEEPSKKNRPRKYRPLPPGWNWRL